MLKSNLAELMKAKYGADYYNKMLAKARAGIKKPRGFGSPVKDKNGLTGRQRAKVVGSMGGKQSYLNKLNKLKGSK